MAGGDEKYSVVIESMAGGGTSWHLYKLKLTFWITSLPKLKHTHEDSVCDKIHLLIEGKTHSYITHVSSNSK